MQEIKSEVERMNAVVGERKEERILFADIAKIFNSPDYLEKQRVAREVAYQKQRTKAMVHDAVVIVCTLLVVTGVYFLIA